MPEPVVPGKLVRCSKCGREYVLCPADDYYNATNNEDGICETCMVLELGATRMEVVNPAQGERLQREFEREFEKDRKD